MATGRLQQGLGLLLEAFGALGLCRVSLGDQTGRSDGTFTNLFSDEQGKVPQAPFGCPSPERETARDCLPSRLLQYLEYGCTGNYDSLCYTRAVSGCPRCLESPCQQVDSMGP